jgi:hypothetical protein
LWLEAKGTIRFARTFRRGGRAALRNFCFFHTATFQDSPPHHASGRECKLTMTTVGDNAHRTVRLPGDCCATKA